MALGVVSNFDRGTRTYDYLNNFRFHVMDVSFTPPPVFTLVYGFSTCTAPEMQIDLKEFKEGNFEYKKSVIHGAAVSDVTFTQGARLFNSDFYDWVSKAVVGQEPVRRNLLILQYADVDSKVFGTLGSAAIGAIVGAQTGGLVGAVAGAATGTLSAGFSALSDVIVRPPVRAWLLQDCLPVSYKSGTDFDALGDQMSLMELTVRPTTFTEINTGIS